RRRARMTVLADDHRVRTLDAEAREVGVIEPPGRLRREVLRRVAAGAAPAPLRLQLGVDRREDALLRVLVAFLAAPRRVVEGARQRLARPLVAGLAPGGGVHAVERELRTVVVLAIEAVRGELRALVAAAAAVL